MMKHRRLALLFCALTISSTKSDARNPALDLRPFRDGDVVANAGDSITHLGKFTANLVTFYALRYPDRVVQFHNVGVGGGTAATITERLDWDISFHQPTVVTVMTGMNDSGRDHYLNSRTGPEIEQRRLEVIQRYQKDIPRLVEEIRRQTSARIVLITPSPFDQATKIGSRKNLASNDILDHFSDYLFRFAVLDDRVRLVDVHNPMNRINARVQKEEPSFTLCGTDRMHPDDLGHLVMAFYFLKAQEVNPLVYDVEISVADRQVARAERAAVSEIEASPEEFSFTMTAESLPYPIPENCRRIVQLVPFAKTLNHASLQVTGLSEGDYRLSIDGVNVGSFSSERLNEGIDLASNEKTPSHQQARSVEQLGTKWHEISLLLRNAAYTERTLRWEKIDLTNDAAVQEKIDSIRNNPKTPHYVLPFLDDYEKARGRRGTLRGEKDRIAEQMRERAKPTKHRFVLTQGAAASG